MIIFGNVDDSKRRCSCIPVLDFTNIQSGNYIQQLNLASASVRIVKMNRSVRMQESEMDAEPKKL